MKIILVAIMGVLSISTSNAFENKYSSLEEFKSVANEELLADHLETLQTIEANMKQNKIEGRSLVCVAGDIGILAGVLMSACIASDGKHYFISGMGLKLGAAGSVFYAHYNGKNPNDIRGVYGGEGNAGGIGGAFAWVGGEVAYFVNARNDDSLFIIGYMAGFEAHIEAGKIEVFQ